MLYDNKENYTNYNCRILNKILIKADIEAINEINNGIFKKLDLFKNCYENWETDINLLEDKVAQSLESYLAPYTLTMTDDPLAVLQNYENMYESRLTKDRFNEEQINIKIETLSNADEFIKYYFNNRPVLKLIKHNDNIITL